MGDVALLKEGGERLTKTAVTASIDVMNLLRPTNCSDFVVVVQAKGFIGFKGAHV